MLSLYVPTGLSVLPHSVLLLVVKVVIITAHGRCSYHGHSHESNYILCWSTVGSWKLRMLNTIITLSKDCEVHQTYCLFIPPAIHKTKSAVTMLHCSCYISPSHTSCTVPGYCYPRHDGRGTQLSLGVHWCEVSITLRSKESLSVSVHMKKIRTTLLCCV